MKVPLSVLYLFLLYSLTGGRAVRWTMTVPARVNGTKGQSAVLPCSFTHPQQQSFEGEILVKWIAGDFYGDPIFQCSVSNSTEGRSDECSDPSAPGVTLCGEPSRKGPVTAHPGLEFSDIRRYYCRVELDRTRRTMYQHGTGTWLHVSGPAEILNLSVVPGPMPGNSSLECMAEGNPRPTLTCQPSAGPVPRSLVTTATDRFRVTVRVPITSQDTYVCRATNQHGTAEQAFPLHQGPSALTLGLSISAALMLLGLVCVLLFLKQRGPIHLCSFEHRSRQKYEADSQHAAAPESEIPLYANSSEIKGNNELVYADINVNALTKSPQRYTMTPGDDVNYAELAFC